MVVTLDKLAGDLESAEFQHGCDQGFWELVHRDGMSVFVRLNAPDGRHYLLKLDCSGYGDEPIAGQFVDNDRRCVNSAWPKGNSTFEQWVKFKDANPFICWPQDRIAIDVHHRDWRAAKSWTTKKNQLVAYINFLRELLHYPARGYERMSLASTN